MKTTSTVAILGSIALSALLLASTTAQAQPRQDEPGRNAGPQHQSQPQPRATAPRQPQRTARAAPQRNEPAGVAVGRPLPRDYRSHQYRVDNWQAHRLPRPSRNQHWVQHGADYLLINAAGVIVQIYNGR